MLLSADYSQIELRLIAEISGDEAMLEAFQKGLDIHQATAARVYGVPLEAVSSEQRRAAKTVNFSIIYGAGATNLSNQLGIKRAEAKELIENYFKQYTGLKKYMENTVEFARKHHYVETLMGRRRHLRDIESRNGMSRSMAERMAINTPIPAQGFFTTAAAAISFSGAAAARPPSISVVSMLMSVFRMSAGIRQSFGLSLMVFWYTILSYVNRHLLRVGLTGRVWP